MRNDDDDDDATNNNGKINTHDFQYQYYQDESGIVEWGCPYLGKSSEKSCCVWQEKEMEVAFEHLVQLPSPAADVLGYAPS